MTGSKNRNRILSLVLAFFMVMSMMPLPTYAAELCDHHTEHTAECGYVEGVSDCTYHCDVCSGHDHGDKVTEEDTEPAPVCDCGTDDGLIHATTCAVYVAPEHPVCDCAEKCTEVNEWCDICGFDYTACGGTDFATPFVDETTVVEAMWGDSVESLTSSGTLDEAVAAQPAYIQLHTDVTRSTSITFNYTGKMTLDLNGKTLKKNWTGGGNLLILQGGELTIVDTAEGGKIDASSGNSGNAIAVGGDNAILKLESGTCVAKVFAVLAGDGTTYLNGGTVQSTSDVAVCATNGEVIVTGSELVSDVASIQCYDYTTYTDYSVDLTNATGESYTFLSNEYEAMTISNITLPTGWAFFDSTGTVVDIKSAIFPPNTVLTAKSKYVNAPTLNIADGGIVLTESDGEKYYQQGSNAATAYTGEITITGTSNASSITVQSGTHNVVLSDLNISAAAPFDISAGATVTFISAVKTH